MSEWERIVCDMLSCTSDDVPQDLLGRLSRVSVLCEKAGGSLNSRQVIATVVEKWWRENKDREE